MKNKLLIFGIVFLLVFQIGFVFSNGPIEEDIASFSIDAIEYTVPEEDTSRLTFIKEIIGDVKLTIDGVEFKNILSQKQAGHPSYIELNNKEGITKVDYTVNEFGGTYLINEVEFELPGNSRIYYDQETGFKFPKGTQIKSIRGITVNKETGRISTPAFNKNIFFEGKDINFFDEIFLNGEGYMDKKGFHILDKSKAFYKGMEISGKSDVLIVTDPLTDLSNYGGNWIKQTPTTWNVKSSETGSVYVRVLEENEILGNSEYSKLNINVEKGDGLEITLSKGTPRILHRSSENGATNIQDGRLDITLNEKELLINTKDITVEDILSKKYRSVPFSIVSDSENIREQLEIDSYGEASLVGYSGLIATYNDYLSKTLLENNLEHEELTEIAQILKDNAGDNADDFLNNNFPKILYKASEAGFSKVQSLHLFKKIIEFAGEDSFMIFADLYGDRFERGLLDKIKIKENSDKIIDSLLKTVESASNAGVPQNLEYSNQIFLEALEKGFDLDLTVDYIDEAFKLNQKKDGFSILHSDFLRAGLNEYDGSNFGEIKQGIKILRKYNPYPAFSNNFDLRYTNIKNKQDLSRQYASLVSDYVEKGDLDLAKISIAASYINVMHDNEGRLEGTDEIREIIARDLSYKAKYLLISQANGLLYQSTFDELYKNFPDNPVEQIKQIDPKGDYLVDFSVEMASRGKLKDLLEEDSSFIINAIEKGLSIDNEEKLFKNSFLLTDTISEYYDNPKYQKEKKDFEDFLLRKYKRAKTKEQEAIYAYFLKLNENPLNNKIEKISENLPDIMAPILPKLWSNKKIIAAKLYFYDDEPWFDITKNDYENNYGMKLIKSSNRKARLEQPIAGKIIRIDLELVAKNSRPNNIKEILESQEYVLVAHRGHSYHSKQTFSADSIVKKILYLGSCGSFGCVPEMQKKYPFAHIISDKGVGKGAISNKVIYFILVGIAKGESTWDTLKPDFAEEQDLVFPDDKSQLLRSYVNQYINKFYSSL